MPTIAISIPKGGVGKSTITCLLAEWLVHRGRTVEVTDADPNETSREWLRFCQERGRTISTPGAEYHLIDTAGREGSSHQLILGADAVLAPFQALQADMSRLVAWFLTMNPRIQHKVAFIPNRLRALGSREQATAVEQVFTLTRKEKAGVLLPGLIDRIAVYSPLFDGSGTNFFDLDPEGNQSMVKAQEETDSLFTAVSNTTDSSYEGQLEHETFRSRDCKGQKQVRELESGARVSSSR